MEQTHSIVTAWPTATRPFKCLLLATRLIPAQRARVVVAERQVEVLERLSLWRS